MSKIVVIPNNKEFIEKYNNTDIDLLIGIDGFSVNTYNVDIDYIDQLSGNNIFLSLNKNIFNSELKKVEELLIRISNMNIKGLFYYDVAILNMVKRLNLDINLIWSCEHYTTNFYTINYWYDKGVKSTFLSNEITKKEMLEIIDNTEANIFIQLFGYIPMYMSKRHAVKNYLNHFKLDLNSSRYYLFKEDKKYSIIDNELGTSIYTNFILNGLKEYNEIKDKLDYVIINGFDIDSDSLDIVIESFKTVNDSNIENLDNDIQSLFPNLEKGFLYEETIYRVKK